MDWVGAVLQGILVGGQYALFACGLSLMFGTMRVINLAHGDLAILAAFLAVEIAPTVGLSGLAAVAVVVPIFLVLGYVGQRTLLQSSLDRGPFTVLLVTFGLSVVIQNLLLEVYSADSHSIQIGSLVSRSIQVTSQISIAYLSLGIFVLAVVVLLGLQYFLSRARTGRMIRAVADDPEAARLSGVDHRHVFGVAAALAFGTVALAGLSFGMTSSFSAGRRPEPAAVRVRGGGHRRTGLAVGDPRRRNRPRRGAKHWGTDRPEPADPCRQRRVPGGAGDPSRRDHSAGDRYERRHRAFGRVAGPGGGSRHALAAAAPVDRRARRRRGASASRRCPTSCTRGPRNTLVNLFILLTIASMWNLLAGYAGLVSVGQQAYIGLGAYIVLFVTLHGVPPFAAIPIAALGCAVLAVPISLLVFRLRGGYFAIATWVVADTCRLLVSRSETLGGGTGAGVSGFTAANSTVLDAYTYWASLAVAVLALAATYMVLRGRLGLVLTAVRDNEVGARSAGARVKRAKRIVYLVAGAGLRGGGGAARRQPALRPAGIGVQRPVVRGDDLRDRHRRDRVDRGPHHRRDPLHRAPADPVPARRLVPDPGGHGGDRGGHLDPPRALGPGQPAR